jgi:hypothetical protein
MSIVRKPRDLPVHRPPSCFTKYSGPLAYGLDVVPPWADGGHLTINLPEHLEYMPGTQGILRHNDSAPRGHWEITDAGRTATLDVDSPTAEGVHVKAVAKVTGADRIEITFRIQNNGKIPLGTIIPLFCSHYRYLTGFPQYTGNFRHTYVLFRGKPTALADIPTQRADADVKGAPVIGCPQRGDWFAAKHGGYIEAGVDAALTAVAALDGKRKLIVAWTPGKSMLSNANIPCIHADPYFGTIPPGEAREAKGLYLFTTDSLAQLLPELRRSGLGRAGGATR